MFFIFLFITVTRTENGMPKVQKALYKFIEESGMKNDRSRYTEPMVFRTTKWGARECGWSAMCSICGKTSSVNTIRKGGKRLTIKCCEHSDKPAKQLKDDDAYVRIFQENDYDSEEILNQISLI